MVKSAPPRNIELVLNEDLDHSSVLGALLSSARRFQCMTAFAKDTGLKFIRKELEGRLKKGMGARFVIGLDFYQTDPSVLEELLALTKRYALELLVSRPDAEGGAAWNFHPKVFTFEGADEVTVLVGSANLTGGGMADNHEASILVRDGGGELSERIDREIEQLIADREIVPANLELVRRYARRHAIYNVQREAAERRARRNFDKVDKQGGLQVDTLETILTEMKADPTDQGFRAQIKSRSECRKASRALLARISASPPMSKKGFLKLYEPLVASSWHSGGLQRGKNVVAQSAPAFQHALRSLSGIASLTVENAFAVLHEKMLEVDRAGINVMSEILHSWDNRRFVVMNQNSVYGLSLANITEFPKQPNKQNVGAAEYGRFCERAGAVRDSLGLKNFTELDALFNYAYWSK